MTPMERYIRDYSASIGLRPEIVMRVVLSEGGRSSLDPSGYTRQSLVGKGRDQEQSYGPLQMNIRGGLGARALAAGIDVRNPADAFRGVKFGLDVMKAEGLGHWMGWKGDKWAANMGQGTGADVATPQGTTLTTTPRHVGGAGSSAGYFTTDSESPSSAVVASDTPTPEEEPKGWADKLSDMIQSKDATALVKNLTGTGGKDSESGGQAKQSGDQPIQSILPSLEASDMARIQASQSLMAQIMARKRQRGLSLTGVPNAISSV